MPAKMIDFEDWEAERMRDPEFRAACEALEPEYQAARRKILANLAAKGLITPAKHRPRVVSPLLKLEGKSLSECLDEIRGE